VYIVRPSSPDTNSPDVIYQTAVNRLDRLTSGLMIVPLSSSRARSVSDEFIEGKVQKEYVARVKGCFSACVICKPEHSRSHSPLIDHITGKKSCVKSHS
jgi:23S rRNA-/tRNA-specific pseudouridylate synthase